VSGDLPDLVIRAGRVVTPTGIIEAEIEIREGLISTVRKLNDRAEMPAGQRSSSTAGSSGSVSPPAGAVIDLATDEVLMPGLVDTHVHINEPGRTHWEGFATATAAAAAGGVTTLIDMPLNSIPPTTDVAALEAKRQAAAGNCAVDVGFWAGAVPANSADRRGLHEAGAFGFKCFLVDSGVHEFPPLDDEGLMTALRQVAEFGSLLVVHAEDPACLVPAGGGSYAEFLRSRPPAAEVAAVARLIDGARGTGARVHVLHLSSAAAVPLLAAAQADGVPITAETCPHYLALAAEEVRPGQTQFKCCPPIREAANRERLWAALAEGVIGCVVSDHSPCPPELKGVGTSDFAAAWGGISSVQLGLPVVWDQAAKRGHDLADVARWMADGPARLAGLAGPGGPGGPAGSSGLAGKGAIAEGYAADLVAFAPAEEFVVEADRLLTRHKLTPYLGRRLRGVVRRTWLGGVDVSTDRGAGKLLRAGQP